MYGILHQVAGALFVRVYCTSYVTCMSTRKENGVDGTIYTEYIPGTFLPVHLHQSQRRFCYIYFRVKCMLVSSAECSARRGAQDHSKQICLD